MEDVWMDLRLGARGLTRRAAFTGLVCLVLGLGLGGATVMFSVVNGVLLEPLDYEDADGLVAVFRHERDLGQQRNPTSPADFLDWSRESQTLTTMTAAHPWAPSLTGREAPTRLSGLKASPSLFTLLGARPALGRVFLPEDEAPESSSVVVLSHRLWQRQFGEDPGLIGGTVTLDGEGYTVIGVMPPGFAFPPFWATEAAFWSPLTFEGDESANRRAQYLRVFARLERGRDLIEARTELSAIAARLERAYPDTNRNASVNVEPLKEPVVANARPALLTLFGAVGLLLLVACANVAHLLLSQASSRRGEIAVRLALGAGRARLARAFLIEVLLLCIGGGLSGLALAYGALDLLRGLAVESVPRLAGVTLDERAFVFALVLSLITGALFGIAPSITASRTSLVPSLPSRGSRRVGTNRFLVAGEVCVALLLLVGAGLLMRSYLELSRLDPGFVRRDLLTMDLPLAGSVHATPDGQLRLMERVRERVLAIPGVDSVAFVNHLPIGGDIWQTPFVPEGSETVDPPPRASYRTASRDFFQTLGATIEQGRSFDDRDSARSAPVVIINRTLARRYFGENDAVGRRLKRGSDPDAPWLTIVGVVSDLRQWSLTEEVRPEIFFPYTQNPVSWWTTTSMLVRSKREPTDLAQSVRARVWELDANLPLTEPRTIEAILERDARQPRLQSWILALFALNAIGLAAVGVYGVVAHSVHQRKRELGIRSAVGAAPGDLVALIVGEGLRLTVAGASCGVLISLLVSRWLSSLLFGITATDPSTFLLVAVFVLGVGLLASYIPARRAVLPFTIDSLREE